MPARELCNEIYLRVKRDAIENGNAERLAQGRVINNFFQKSNERAAQKEAITISFQECITEFPDEDPASIWHHIQSVHVESKTGLEELTSEQISSVDSAIQSWKKSSGHAFEEAIPNLINPLLEVNNLKIILQRELNQMLGRDQISNKPRDIEILNSWVQSSAFDLYTVIYNEDEQNYSVFGCVQAKTSIRDRVTRDREPSLLAMGKYFWSIAVVLDGDFLRLPKFSHMVNGGSDDYEHNGWHGMYVFSSLNNLGRIHLLDRTYQPLIAHTNLAAEYWNTHRQWLDVDYDPNTQE